MNDHFDMFSLIVTTLLLIKKIKRKLKALIKESLIKIQQILGTIKTGITLMGVILYYLILFLIVICFTYEKR